MHNKKNKGLTLIELVITVGILGLIMTAATTVVLSGFESFAASRRLQYDQNEARFTVIGLSRDIQYANIVEIEDDGNTLRLTVPHPSTPNETLQVVYALNGTALQRRFYLADGVTPTQIPPTYPVVFVGTNLSYFHVERGNAVNPSVNPNRWEAHPQGQWVRITFTTHTPNQWAPITASTTVALQRTGATPITTPDESEEI